MANRKTAELSREEAQIAISRVLLNQVRRDQYPSTTHMSLLEQTLPPSLRREYLKILLEKIYRDPHPSISMISRVQQFSEQI